jgi:gag-polyprotein putative aspartyl protease
MQPQLSFTVKSTAGILRVLQTTCGVAEAFDPAATSADKRPQFHNFQAIWDTGATGSVITQKVVDTCALKPVSMTEVHSIQGKEDSEVYLVNIVLPNGVGCRQIRVTKGRIINADVLIGMDIITLGDFAITNQGGRTVFTFCVPSQRSLDFVEELKQLQQLHVLPQGKPGFRGFVPATPAKPKRHK